MYRPGSTRIISVHEKSNYIWNFLLIAALTAGALWFALKDNYQEVMDAIGKISPLGLVVILSWGFSSPVCGGLPIRCSPGNM